MELLSPMHLLLVLGIALLVFGPRKLPELGKGLGEAIRGFKTGIHGDGDDQKPAPRSTDGPENSNRPPSS